MATLRKQMLRRILSQPTAPFREGHVISAVLSELESAGVPFFKDPIGNLILGVSSQAEYLRMLKEPSDDPVRFFIAHMDHPGFHGSNWKSETELEVKWHGGSPTQYLEGAEVWLADKSGWVGQGKLKNAQLLASGRAIQTASIVDLVASASASASDVLGRSPLASRRAKSLYGGFSFRSPWWQEGEVIYTKAADDLVGVFAIVSMALDLYAREKTESKKDRRKNKNQKQNQGKTKKNSKQRSFIGLLTRAEEVGFIGAIGHFDLGWLKKAKRPVLCVSLETSRALPGAEIGKGPVVRLGDRFTVFDPGALKILSDLGQAVLPGKHQRRIMDGGTCEATAATAFGFSSIGISVPLGNYHNQSFEGGPDSSPSNGPAPEFVHLGDVAGMIELCRALMEPDLPWAKPWAKGLEKFRRDFAKAQGLLSGGP